MCKSGFNGDNNQPRHGAQIALRQYLNNDNHFGASKTMVLTIENINSGGSSNSNRNRNNRRNEYDMLGFRALRKYCSISIAPLILHNENCYSLFVCLFLRFITIELFTSRKILLLFDESLAHMQNMCESGGDDKGLPATWRILIQRVRYFFLIYGHLLFEI